MDETSKYASKLKVIIRKWNVEDDHLQTEANRLKADHLNPLRIQFEELSAKRRDHAERNSALQYAREVAWEDAKEGVEVVRQALVDLITASKECSSQLATPLAK